MPSPPLPASRRPPPRTFTLGALAAGLCCVASLGCKPPPGQAPHQPRIVDDIDAIERELASNESELASQGILIAHAEPTSPAAGADAGGAQGDAASVDESPADDVADEPSASSEAPEPEPAAPIERSTAVQEEGRPRRLGVSRGDRRYARERKRDEASRCERICDLADATCDLADQICGLADKHVDEVRYEDACERAATQCRLASAACTNCDD